MCQSSSVLRTRNWLTLNWNIILEGPLQNLWSKVGELPKSQTVCGKKKNSARNSGILLLRYQFGLSITEFRKVWSLSLDDFSFRNSPKYSRFANLYSLLIRIFIPQLKGYLKTTFPYNTLECVLSAALTIDEYIKSSFLPRFLFSCQLSGQKRLVNSLIVVIDLMNCC